MKSTWKIHAIFIIFVLPVFYVAQGASNHIAETARSPYLILALLFGLPLLYFVLWFAATIYAFKRKSKIKINEKIEVNKEE